MPSVLFLIMNQLAESPLAMLRVFWLAMMRMKNSTSAGASRLSAVPPMVWSARRLIDANDSSSENSAPMAADMSMASSTRPCSVPQSPAALAAMKVSTPCIWRTKSTPMNAPKIMMPSTTMTLRGSMVIVSAARLWIV